MQYAYPVQMCIYDQRKIRPSTRFFLNMNTFCVTSQLMVMLAVQADAIRKRKREKKNNNSQNFEWIDKLTKCSRQSKMGSHILANNNTLTFIMCATIRIYNNAHNVHVCSTYCRTVVLSYYILMKRSDVWELCETNENQMNGGWLKDWFYHCITCRGANKGNIW